MLSIYYQKVVPSVRVELTRGHPYRLLSLVRVVLINFIMIPISNQFSGCVCRYGLSDQGRRPKELDIMTTPVMQRRQNGPCLEFDSSPSPTLTII